MLNKFLLLYSDDLSRDMPALADLLRERTDQIDFDLTWHPWFGELWRATLGRGEHAWYALTLLGIRSVALRLMPGVWSAPLPEIPLVFDRWLLPPGNWITVGSDGQSANLCIRSGQVEHQLLFTWWDGQWCSEQEPALGVVAPGMQIVPSNAVPPGATQGLGDMAVPDLQPVIAESCMRALALLNQVGFQYETWVRKVIRQIIPLQVESNRTRSGSLSEYPGAVHMSLPEPAMVVADNLVHEASHQYFHLAGRIEAVDTGDDQALYYSPVVGKKRPLSRILLAFHAFGNVALLYEDCLAQGVQDGGYCVRKRTELAEYLPQLYAPLADNPTLSNMGSALLRPLALRLRNLKLL